MNGRTHSGIKERICSGYIEIEGSGDWPVDALLGVAARRNSSRGYLLVSKVLGKHIPTPISKMHNIYKDLSRRLPTDLIGPVAFIGMGETATALGLGVFKEWCQRSKRRDAMYMHTTRYQPHGIESISFQEIHSHGPTQLLCLPVEAKTRELWSEIKTLIVIDDEVTTGSTAESLALALETHGIRVHQKVLVALVSPRDQSLISQSSPDWHIISLARILVKFHPTGPQPSQSNPQGITFLKVGIGSHKWGRMAIISKPDVCEETLAQARIAAAGKDEIHIIGSGECMYPAFLIGKELREGGRQVTVQATTRSPVIIGNAIRKSVEVQDGLGSGVSFFLHNPPSLGDCVIALHERGARKSSERLVEMYGATALEV